MKKAILLTLCLCLTGLASADLVVGYDSSTQIGSNMNQPFTTASGQELGGGYSDDQMTTITLANNDVTPWSNTAGDYNGPAFKIVWEGIALNEGASWDSRDSNPISIRFQTNGSDIDGIAGKDGAGNFHLAVIFETESVSLDASSSLLLDVARLEGGVTARWLVRDGSTFYVSQSTVSGDTTFDNAAGLLTEMWAEIDLAAGADFDQDAASYSTPTSALTDLTAFGLHVDKDALTSARHWVDIRKFQVDAVPEPATMSLLGLGGLAVLRRRRK